MRRGKRGPHPGWIGYKEERDPHWPDDYPGVVWGCRPGMTLCPPALVTILILTSPLLSCPLFEVLGNGGRADPAPIWAPLGSWQPWSVCAKRAVFTGPVVLVLRKSSDRWGLCQDFTTQPLLGTLQSEQALAWSPLKACGVQATPGV